jgi:hypothetical protein
MKPDPDLIKVTEIFLIPSSFLVAALGTADTMTHKAAVSLLGLIVSALWLVCTREAYRDELPDAAPGRDTTRRLILAWLATVFCVGWLVSTISHAWLARPTAADPPAATTSAGAGATGRTPR